MSIRIEALHFTYFEDRKDTIPGLSAVFDADKITVLTGPSGCGKSTLLYLAAGIYPRSAGLVRSGRILVEGRDPAQLPPQERCRLVGMMFQNPELQFCMDTVRNELIFCLENCSTDPAEVEAQMDRALEFCEITDLKHRTLHSLSGGQKQKVMLACLVALDPKWLLLDEPFANVDDTSARFIAKKLLRLHRERGTGILAVDHRLDNWLETAREIRIMDGGLLREQRLDPTSLDPAQLEELGVIVPGRHYRSPETPAPPGIPVLTLEGLSVHHGSAQILQGLSMEFRSGSVYAVVGESGCGKSTLFGALSGMYPYTGKVLLEGKPLKKHSPGAMGFVTQSPQDQFVADTVLQELLVSLRSNPKAEETAEQILRSIGLWRYRSVSAYLLSQGQQRRLGVAALMAYRCRVLVCDEPTYAQDRNNTVAIMDRLLQLVREQNIVLIFSTHDRQLAADYADEVWELKEGVLHGPY